MVNVITEFNPLLGVGLQDIPVRTVGTQTITGNLITYGTDIILFNSATPITSTLPTLASYNNVPLTVKNIGVGLVTLDGNGTETIDGTLIKSIYTGEAFTIVPSATQWETISIGGNFLDVLTLPNTNVSQPVYGSEGNFIKTNIGTNFSGTASSNTKSTAVGQVSEITQAYTGQTASLKKFQDSSGNDLFEITVLGGLVNNSSGTVKTVNTTIVAGDLRAFLPIVGTGGNVNCSTIAAGTNGQRMLLMGTDDTNTVTFTSATTFLKLNGGVSFTMGLGDTMELMYSTINSINKWCEISRSNNT